MNVGEDRQNKKNGIKLCLSSSTTKKGIKMDNLKLKQYFKYLHQ